MDFIQYLALHARGDLPDPGHWATAAGLAVVAVFLAWVAYKDVRRPDRVPDDAGPDPRVPLFRETTASLWTAAGLTTGAWLTAGGSWHALGFRPGGGLGTWIAWGLTALAVGILLIQRWALTRSHKMRQDFARQLDGATGYDWVRPSSEREYRWFQVMAVTAGVTEEVIFRGFLIGVLALWAPVWAAALLSVAVFVGGHVYQGLSGMTRILPVSLALTAIFLLSGSLAPAVFLHVAVDVLGGDMMWRLRHYRGITDESSAPGSGVSPRDETGSSCGAGLPDE